MGEGAWEVYQTDEVAAWMQDLRRTDPQAAEKVEAAVDVLTEYGPTLGRPLVDTLVGSKLANLKELRPRQTNIRVLFSSIRGGQPSCWSQAIRRANGINGMKVLSRGRSNCLRSPWRSGQRQRRKAVTSFSKWD